MTRARSGFTLCGVLGAIMVSGCLFESADRAGEVDGIPCNEGALDEINSRLGSWIVCLPMDFNSNGLESLVAAIEGVDGDAEKALASQQTESLDNLIASWKSYRFSVSSLDGGRIKALGYIASFSEANATIVNGTWGDVERAIEARAQQPEPGFKTHANRLLAPDRAALSEAKVRAALPPMVATVGGAVIGTAVANFLATKASKKAAYWRAFGKGSDIETRLFQLARAAIILAAIGGLSLMAVGFAMEAPLG